VSRTGRDRGFAASSSQLLQSACGLKVVGAVVLTLTALYVVSPIKGQPIPPLWPRFYYALLGLRHRAVLKALWRGADGHGTSLEANERRAQEVSGRFVDAWRFAFARTGDADDALGLSACSQAGDGAADVTAPRDIEDKDGMAELAGKPDGALGSARAETVIIEQNHERVAVAHVPLGALNVIAKRGFLQHGIKRKHARRARHVLCPAAFRAPSAAGDTPLDRRIESSAIDPRLAAREDLHHASHQCA